MRQGSTGTLEVLRIKRSIQAEAVEKGFKKEMKLELVLKGQLRF